MKMMPPLGTLDSTRALLEQLVKVAEDHPGDDAEVMTAVMMLAGTMVAQSPPYRRREAFDFFMQGVAVFLEQAP
jgi:hypothetical protein